MRHPIDRWDASDNPSVVFTTGASSVRQEDPPKGWKPPAAVGFVSSGRQDHDDTTEPLLWEGDYA